MAATYILDTIKVGGNKANLLARSTGENVTTTYRDVSTTLESTLSTIAEELDSKETTTYDEATQSVSGLMSALDKTRLDSLHSIRVGDGAAPDDMVDGEIYIRRIPQGVAPSIPNNTNIKLIEGQALEIPFDLGTGELAATGISGIWTSDWKLDMITNNTATVSGTTITLPEGTVKWLRTLEGSEKCIRVVFNDAPKPADCTVVDLTFVN